MTQNIPKPVVGDVYMHEKYGRVHIYIAANNGLVSSFDTKSKICSFSFDNDYEGKLLKPLRPVWVRIFDWSRLGSTDLSDIVPVCIYIQGKKYSASSWGALLNGIADLYYKKLDGYTVRKPGSGQESASLLTDSYEDGRGQLRCRKYILTGFSDREAAKIVRGIMQYLHINSCNWAVHCTDKAAAEPAKKLGAFKKWCAENDLQDEYKAVFSAAENYMDSSELKISWLTLPNVLHIASSLEICSMVNDFYADADAAEQRAAGGYINACLSYADFFDDYKAGWQPGKKAAAAAQGGVRPSGPEINKAAEGTAGIAHTEAAADDGNRTETAGADSGVKPEQKSVCETGAGASDNGNDSTENTAVRTGCEAGIPAGADNDGGEALQEDKLTKVPFTEEETIILHRAALKVIEGSLKKQEAIKLVSEALRKLAAEQDMEIDDSYRSNKGISSRLSFMEAVIMDKIVGRPPARVFVKIADMYKTNRAEYDRLVEKAEGKVRAAHSEISDEELVRTKIILTNRFSKGFRFGSFIDLRKYQGAYSEEFGTCDLADDLIKNSIRKCCIFIDKKAYLPDSLVGDDLKARLLQYIADVLDSGKSAVYYSAIYKLFYDALLESRINNAEMLKEYLKNTVELFRCGDEYICGSACLSPKDEIIQLLENRVMPVRKDDITQELSHISEKAIGKLLKEPEFCDNGGSEYFCLSCYELSESEVNKIAGLIDDYTGKDGTITKAQLIPKIKEFLPEIYDQYENLSDTGWYNILKSKLNDRYEFNHNSISTAGTKAMSRKEAFAEFAGQKTFTTDMLKEFAEARSGNKHNIDFNTVYDKAVKINETEFVSADSVDFDTAETDKAIGQYCTGDFIPLKGVYHFNSFPWAGYPWNIYLLESYVYNHSREYRLADGISGTPVGVIMKRSCNYSMDEILVHALAESNIELTEDDAFVFLIENGYLANKGKNNMGTLIIEAQNLRLRRE